MVSKNKWTGEESNNINWRYLAFAKNVLAVSKNELAVAKNDVAVILNELAVAKKKVVAGEY